MPALRSIARALLLFLVLCGAGGPAVVAAQSPSGTIEGNVVDTSGAVLPGVTVTLTEANTGTERVATADAAGHFIAALLPVGVYNLRAELAGFVTYKLPEIRLTIGQTLTLTIEMAVGGVAETVTVSGATPLIETSRSDVSATVGEVAVQNLPVNGRNFIDFALLTPGVTRDTRTGDISFAGQRGTLNSLVIDGADDNNTFFGQTAGRTGSGRAPYQFSQDAVKEFQVNSNAFSAEYGRAGGAVINVVTMSGTNDLHGSLFEFYRDKALNANNVINVLNNRPKSPYHYNQFGGTAGGPIRKNRDFFFVNYDGQRNTQPNIVFLNLPSSTPSDPATQAAIARLQPLAASWQRTLDQDVYLAKTDHAINDSNRLTLRYNHQDFTGENFENGGAQNSLEHTGASLVKTRAFNASFSSVLTGRLFNEVRFQYSRDSEPGRANSDNPEAVIQQSGTTVLTIGRNNFSPRETTIRRWQIADTLTAVKGSHKLKSVFDLQFDNILNRFPGFFSGSYTFRSLASFADGRPDGPNELYQQNFAGPGTTGAVTMPSVHEYSAFVQDEWKPVTALAINAGVRYDLMKTEAPPVRNPDPQLAAAGIDTSRLDADTNNIGPRLGLAWSPQGRPFVVRGGWGLFYGRTPSIMLGTAHSNNGVNIVSLTFTGDDVPTYPQHFDAIPSIGAAVRPTIFYIDKDFANARVMQANAAFEWQLGPQTTITATYLFADGDDLPRSIDRNIGTEGSRTFTIAGTGTTVTYPFFGADRPFGNFQRVIAFEATAVSRYNGLTLELNRRFAGNTQFRLAYTLGKVVDTVPDATAVVPGNPGDDVKYASNPADFDVDRTAGNNDQRHRFVASGVFSTAGLATRLDGFWRALADGWSLSGILTAQSGQPYTARVGAVDLNNDGNTRNDIAPGTRRNQFRLPAMVSLDPRIARDLPAGALRVQLIWEAFNLFNRNNISAVDTTYYSVSGTTLTPGTTFGRPTASSGERIMQLAVKVRF
jgi:hypothetical protein